MAMFVCGKLISVWTLTVILICLTQRDWSLMRLMKRGDSFVRRTSGDVQFETTMKHSAQAFLMPHRLSEHRSKNLGICESTVICLLTDLCISF